MRGVIHHGDNGMRILTLGVFQKLSDDTCFTSSVALDHTDAFPNFEAFLDDMSSGFNLEWFGFFCIESYKAILDEADEAFAIFELALGNLDPITNLDL